MRKRLFAFLLTFCLLLPAWSGFSVLALDSATSEDISLPVTEEPISVDNTFNKIHFYFGSEENAFIDDMAELQSATASVQSDYAATAAMSARSGEPSDENVYITVQFASDYLSDKTYLSLKSARDKAKTAEERDMAKTRQNAYSKSYHAAIVEDNLPLLADIPYTNANPIDYSSFVTLTVPAMFLDTTVLAEIAENESILHVSLTNNFESKSNDIADELTSSTTDEYDYDDVSWEVILQRMNAYNIVENGIYTGRDIKIGVYESGGVCDVNHVNFTKGDTNPNNDTKIFIRDGDTVLDEHADTVASIFAYMVPNAELYVAHRPVNVLRIEGISWFISMGCDIVNCSFFYTYSPTYRYDYDALYDYQIGTSGIVVIASAGNAYIGVTPYLASPGQAHNVITVGGVEEELSTGMWKHAESACYMSNNVNCKPNVSAPFHLYVPNIVSYGVEEISSGTSISAPLVASCIAILKESAAGSNKYWMHPQRIISVIMATADKTDDYSTQGVSKQMDQKVGAGIVNLQRMLDYTLNMYTFYAQGSAGAEVYSKNVYVNSGVEIQIALAWLIGAVHTEFVNENGGIKYVTDYDLYLCDSAGNVISKSMYSNSNTELIRYQIAVAGYYRIFVVQYGSRVNIDPVTLTYQCR